MSKGLILGTGEKTHISFSSGSFHNICPWRKSN